MTAVERTEQEQRWLACYKQRVGARRARIAAADACCSDCGTAVRTDPNDRARHHAALEAEARRNAADAASAALRFRRATIVSTAVIAAQSLLVVVLVVVALLG